MIDWPRKVKARLTAAPIHFLSLCDGIATPYGMALNMGFKVAKYFAFENLSCVDQLLKASTLTSYTSLLMIFSWSLTSSG